MASEKELEYLYGLFENITRIDYMPLEQREELKQLLIEAYKKGNSIFDKIKQDLNKLKELEKKETPHKVKNIYTTPHPQINVFNIDKKRFFRGECPKCGKIFESTWADIDIDKEYPYCSNCGQKLDWR